MTERKNPDGRPADGEGTACGCCCASDGEGPLDEVAPSPSGDGGAVICCSIRCLDPAVVEEAVGQLDPSGAERVSYTCKISGEEEELLLIGDRLAARLAEALPEAEDTGDAKILAGLWSAELCECDLATLTGLPEARVVERLQALTARGVLGHREIHDMNYYHLESEAVRARVEETLGAAGPGAHGRPVCS